MTDAQSANTKKLAQSTEMLTRLLALNAPAVIVCRQVAQIFGQALLAYGEAVYTELGKAAHQSKLIAAGYCPECERKFDREAQAEICPDHCPECREALEAEGVRPSLN